MDRQSKISYLQQLAAGKLAPGDLLMLLPRRVEFWIQSKDGTFNGMTRKELDDYRSDQVDLVDRYLIKRRGRDNKADNERRKIEVFD